MENSDADPFGFCDMEVTRTLDAEGMAVRAGTHCAQPILARFGLESTVRPSFAFYNTQAEADVLLNAAQDQHATVTQTASL